MMLLGLIIVSSSESVESLNMLIEPSSTIGKKKKICWLSGMTLEIKELIIIKE